MLRLRYNLLNKYCICYKKDCVICQKNSNTFQTSVVFLSVVCCFSLYFKEYYEEYKLKKLKKQMNKY